MRTTTRGSAEFDRLRSLGPRADADELRPGTICNAFFDVLSAGTSTIQTRDECALLRLLHPHEDSPVSQGTDREQAMRASRPMEDPCPAG